METLNKQIGRARRRMILQQFFRSLPWCWFVALVAATIWITVDKFQFRPSGIEAWAIVVGGLGIGLIAAAAWTFLKQHSAMDAAIEIDRRFALKERVSSALALDVAQRESGAGEALLSDAARRLERVEVVERFGIRLNRWSLLPLAPALAAFLIAVLLTPVTQQQVVGAKPAGADVKKQVRNSTEALRRRLMKRREEAREQGLTDIDRLFDRLEKGTEEIARNDRGDRKQALIKLNDLARQLQEKRDALGGSKGVQRQLNQLKNLQRGPADKFAQALKQGDFARAMQELEKLSDQLRAGDLDEAQRQRLAKQLADMRDKLQQIVDAHKQLQQQLEKQLQQARAAGKMDEAQKIQERLNQLAQQAPNMEFLQQLAQKLGNAAGNMKQANAKAALGDLQDLQNQLGQLQQQLEEMELTEAALDEIAMAKDAMNCENCQGQGCAECQGGFGWNALDMQGDGGGMGLGAGRGRGPRPEEKTDTGSYESRVKQKVGRGAAIIAGSTDGPNAKGRVQQEIVSEFQSVGSQAADPLTNQRLPRAQREHAKSYLEALREGKQ